MFEIPEMDAIILTALAEDLGVGVETLAVPDPTLLTRDVTSTAVVPEDAIFSGLVRTREEAVICGLPVAARVFELFSTAAGLFDPVEFFPLVAEGAHVPAGTALAEVDGLARAVFTAERTALNLMMLLSGIATETSRWVAAGGPGLAICDTRKTIPGLRELSKYAVHVGGGTNHRVGLFDMVLVKDNHLAYGASITKSVHAAKEAHPEMEVEIEADTIDQAVEAVSAGADLVLLDNMDDSMLAKAVDAIRAAAAQRGRSVLVEASGGITFARLPSLAATGVDRVSASALTITRPIDIGLDDRRRTSW